MYFRLKLKELMYKIYPHNSVLCFTFLQDSIAGTDNSFNLYFSSTMSRPTLLPSSVPFCSVLFLTLATQCLAFPKVEKREMAHAYAQTEQSWKTDTGDGENVSSAIDHMSQQTSSEAPMVLSAGPSVMPLIKSSRSTKNPPSLELDF